jgi:hypothetical protein
MGDNDEGHEAKSRVARDGLISPKLSILLIGSAAIGLIVLMCLTVLIIIAVKT